MVQSFNWICSIFSVWFHNHGFVILFPVLSFFEFSSEGWGFMFFYGMRAENIKYFVRSILIYILNVCVVSRNSFSVLFCEQNAFPGLKIFSFDFAKSFVRLFMWFISQTKYSFKFFQFLILKRSRYGIRLMVFVAAK